MDLNTRIMHYEPEYDLIGKSAYMRESDKPLDNQSVEKNSFKGFKWFKGFRFC